MVNFAVVTSFVLLFVLVAFAEDRVPGRDDWYKHSHTYTDLPRVFDIDEGCPAENFYFDCNRCSCADGKHAACTSMGCQPIPQIVNWKSGRPCPAGKRFYNKCNDCTCAENGRDASCTRKACPNFDDKS